MQTQVQTSAPDQPVRNHAIRGQSLRPIEPTFAPAPSRRSTARMAGAALRRPVHARRGPVDRLMIHTGLLFAFFVATAMLPAAAFPWAWLPIVVANLIVLRGMQLATRELWREWRAAAQS